MKFNFCNLCFVVNPGSSSDLVPTLMDIFDSMIGNQHHHTMSPPSATSDSSCVSSLQPTVAAANASNGHHHHQNNNLSSNQQPSPRHFPVLKIVEPGDPPLRQLTNVSPVASTENGKVSYSNSICPPFFYFRATLHTSLANCRRSTFFI